MGHSKNFSNLTVVANVLISSGKYLKKYGKICEKMVQKVVVKREK